MMPKPPFTIGVGLMGYGYWGPNLARNFASQSPNAKLIAVCDRDPARLERARLAYPWIQTTESAGDLFRNDDIHAVLIATPASTHYQLAHDAMAAGKDVLVEKPLTGSLSEADQLVRFAEKEARILAVDHTFLYTGAVQKIKEIVDAGELGRILYFDSVRVNLGVFQHDVNVLYDLAPHDLSILTYLIGENPEFVQALGATHTESKLENIVYLHMGYRDNLIAHCHLNWLSPVKIRQTILCGTQKMIVYDDLHASEKVKVYDKGIAVREDDPASLHKVLIDYRTGDIVTPKLDHREALAVETEHFLDCVRTRRAPRVDGRMGLRVVRILEAAQASLRSGGSRVWLKDFVPANSPKKQTTR